MSSKNFYRWPELNAAVKEDNVELVEVRKFQISDFSFMSILNHFRNSYGNLTLSQR